MTLTLTNQPNVEEVLSEAAPELPDADLREEHLTNYVGFFVQTKDKCDYYIGLGLIKAHEQWAGVQGSTKGRFRAWCAANTHLIKSNQEAYRLMEWAKNVHAQNLGESPEVIQQLESSLSKGARTELTKADPIVQEAVINDVKETGDSFTAKQIADLQAINKRLEAERDEAVQENQLLADAANEVLAKQASKDKQLKTLSEAISAEKMGKDKAEKKARETQAELNKIQKELEALQNTSNLAVVSKQSVEDVAETARIRQNYVAKQERYIISAAGDWRQSIHRYYEYREFMTADTKGIVDKVMKSIFRVLLDNLDENGDPLADQPSNTPTIVDID
jgi:hypothetical protein